MVIKAQIYYLPIKTSDNHRFYEPLNALKSAEKWKEPLKALNYTEDLKNHRWRR